MRRWVANFSDFVNVVNFGWQGGERYLLRSSSYYSRSPSIHSLAIFNGVNTISRTALNILQGLPLGGDGVEERWRDGRGGSPDENSAVVR